MESLHYRFNLRAWLMNLPLKKRSAIMDSIIEQSGQSRHTIKRIMYSKVNDTTYVRAETKEVICRIFQKSLQELENAPNPVNHSIKAIQHD
ncbi:MAG: hypothetical protein BGO70_16375 [Bacteroidetes bacterium 43-93]|nr:hypothetical protein [Bacteroidota bacterium]OJX01338.1 MAG: hypothetical protein BGO70_16375 [Bacteroidetes bacterium 43-93]